MTEGNNKLFFYKTKHERLLSIVAKLFEVIRGPYGRGKLREVRRWVGLGNGELREVRTDRQTEGQT